MLNEEQKKQIRQMTADANIICFIRQHHAHQCNVLIAERSLEW